jgi:hypothetical protein
MPPKELVDEIEKAYNEYKKEKEKEVDYLTFYNGFVACNRNRQQENNKLLDVINNQDVKIMELEQQIEKMKCCGNCKYSNQESAYSIVCKVGGVDKSDYINVDDNQVCDKWEIKEYD